jgi:hypothetical protein
MFIFSISNHPSISSITRDVVLEQQTADYQHSILTIHLLVRHYVSSSHIPELDKRIYTFVDNKGIIIDPNTGDQVPDFDFIIGMLQTGMTYEQVIGSAVTMADLNGTINTKCNYSN